MFVEIYLGSTLLVTPTAALWTESLVPEADLPLDGASHRHWLGHSSRGGRWGHHIILTERKRF